MKILQTCIDCSKEEQDLKLATNLEYRPIENSSFYEFKCKNGHTTYSILQNPKFEVLYETGINAFKDGYYREAVTSFAVALERFYEFSILVLLTRNKKGIKNEDFEIFWKQISKQSERQVGAFYSLYLNEFCVPPSIFDLKFVKQKSLKIGQKDYDPINFRNIVTHQGYIPNQAESLEYGEAVNKYIQQILLSFKECDSEMIHKAQTFILQVINKNHGKGKQTATMFQNCFINSLSDEYIENGKSLKEIVKK